MKKLPISCPSCSSPLVVSQLACPNCETTIAGSYQLPVLLQLPADDQNFILDFFLNSGSLKKMAADMGKSYPTVRNMLDDIIEKIKKLQTT
ncbi:DUF2089 family protein [bacterium]|nr:DUF2089 family protein [bacterium]